MPKFVAPVLTSGFGSVPALNEAFAELEAALENTVSRDGSSPNQMEADLDLNSFKILNVSAGTQAGDAVNLGQLQELASGVIVSRLEQQLATAAQTLVAFTTLSYQPGQNNLAVYKDGVRLFISSGFTETSATSITLTTPCAGGERIVVVTNVSTGTMDDVPAHTHTTADITNLAAYTGLDARYFTEAEVTALLAAKAALAGATFTGNVVIDADILKKNADSGTTVRQPRVFVQSGDPGAAAQDGDLWLW